MFAFISGSVRETVLIMAIVGGGVFGPQVFGNEEGGTMGGEILQVAGLPDQSEDIVWERLPLLNSRRVMLFEGEEHVSAFSHHPTIAWHDGRFFAAWSHGARDEDASGQRVLYTTSENGFAWTQPVTLAEGMAGKAYTPCGFWKREGEVFALAALRNSRDGAPRSDDNPLMAYRWSKEDLVFRYDRVIATNFFANNAPRRTPDGPWLMTGKPGGGAGSSGSDLRIAKGGVRSMDQWSFAPLPVEKHAHDTFWYVMPNGNLMTMEGTGSVPDRYLMMMTSADGGDSWSGPVMTNFPDADSRLCGLRLSTGRYVLLNNPNPWRYRSPLSLAVSKDGGVYDRMANVRMEQTNKRYSGHAKAPGYQYVRAMEQDGRLWVIYSVNKEDVEISVIPLEEIEQLYKSPQVYPAREIVSEIVIDNTDKGFETDRVWPRDSAANGYYGADYAYLPAATPGWASWTPEISVSGAYHVYLRWATIGFSQRSPMEDIVPVEITHSRGISRTTVDHTRYGGAWIFLGAYKVMAGEEIRVKIGAGGDGITVADAAKFVLIPDAQRNGF